MSQVTVKAINENEVLIVAPLPDGRRVTLVTSLNDDAPAGVWSGGRLTQLMPAREALRLASTSERGLVKALRS